MNGRRLDVPAQASTSTMENPFLSGLGLPFLLGPRPPSAVRRPPIADRRSPPAAMPRHRAVLLLLAGAADEAAAAFSAATPCPPPRFDSFSDAVVGGWERRGGAASSPPSAAPGVDEVQEGMRSCGGAVQGAREVPLGLGRREGEEEKEEDGGVGEGRYHNRADDGFVYFDCGSYSAGPVQLGKGNGRNGEEVMGSLAFSSVPRRRALVSLPVGSGGGDPVCEIRDGRLVVLGRVPFRSSTGGTAASSAAEGVEGGAKGEEGEGTASDALVGGAAPTVEWRVETLARMASPSQPWMLPRAKWERYDSSGGADCADDEAGGEEAPGMQHLACWVEVRREEGGGTDRPNQLHGSEELGTLVCGDGLNLVQVGAWCSATNEARAVLRCYDAVSGKLRGVVLQCGVVRT